MYFTCFEEGPGGSHLEGPVFSHCPFSPCKFRRVEGEKSSGTKEELDPMERWIRAKSNAYFVHYAYYEAGRTSLHHLFIRKIKT